MSQHNQHAASTESVTGASLLLRKMLTAFLTGFLPVFLTGITGLLNNVIDALSHGGTIDFKFLQVTGLALLVGAVMAGVRVVIAWLPVNLVPTDKLLTLGRAAKRTVTVTRR